MEGLHIGRSSGGWAGTASAVAALASLAAAVWIGPKGIFFASGVGFALAAIALVLAFRVPTLAKPLGFPSLLLIGHALLLAAGLALQMLFLSPLSSHRAKMPRLQTLYQDPAGMFEVRGPARWTYVNAPSRFESGVRLRPGDQGGYMGISEATVFVRRLDERPTSPEAFLESAAEAFSRAQSDRRMFRFRTERGRSLSGVPVIWSTISVRRFWIPLYQVSVFGVKDGRYLCSASATGLQAHSTLARVFVLGLFERTVVTDRKS